MFLFQQEQNDLTLEEALSFGRKTLVSFLNKGIVPDWETFFQELPVLASVDDLDTVKSYFEKLTMFSFIKEILEQRYTECFFHSATLSHGLKLDGSKISFEVPLDDQDWQLWLEIMSIKFHQNWNVQNPFVSFYGELFGRRHRLSLIHASTSPSGVSKLFLRSLASTPHKLESFGEVSALPDLIQQKKNILIAGSTGSGKTSLLSSLLTYVNQDEHVVILEDTFEICTSLPYETRLLSGDGPQKSLKSYLAYAMRMSPDRIILGEMRSHEVVPFLMAMNTGHKGLLGTIHASSAHDALDRVALLFSLYSGEARLDYEKIMALLCQNLEYVVFMESKKVKEVIRVLGSERGVPFFERVSDASGENKKAPSRWGL